MKTLETALACGLLALLCGCPGEQPTKPPPKQRELPKEPPVDPPPQVPEELPPPAVDPPQPLDPAPEGFTHLRTESFRLLKHVHTLHVYRSEAFAQALGLGAGQTDPACEFVLVPGGTFTMGSPPQEFGRGEDEGPQHDVTLQPFLLARTEITQQVWEAVMGANPASFKGPRRPVETISWGEAQSFCEKTGLRLPSEAESEYASRRGSTSRYPSGDNDGDLIEVGWYASSSGRETHPVAGRKPNAFGLLDMQGNVWEWCQDVHQDGYEGAPSDGSAWEADAKGKRVYRGGSTYTIASSCRSAKRGRTSPGKRDPYIGFRVAR